MAKKMDEQGRGRVRQQGFTMLEMLMVVVIAGIVAALAAPNLLDIVRNSSINSAAESTFSMIRFARSEAARQGVPVYIGASDGVSWSNGIVVWTETDNNSVYNSSSDTLVRQVLTKGKVSILEMNSKKVIKFNGQGFTTAAIELNICDSNRHGEEGRTINVLISGFASIKKKAVACD